MNDVVSVIMGMEPLKLEPFIVEYVGFDTC